jgi:hypothetical protein
MGAHHRLVAPIRLFHLLQVAVVGHAIEQVDEPIRIQLEGCCLLPELLGAGLVGLPELGLGQLAGEEEQQLTLFQGRKTRGCSLFSLHSLHRTVLPRRRLHSLWASSGFECGRMTPSAMKRSGCYIACPHQASASRLPTPPEDLPW